MADPTKLSDSGTTGNDWNSNIGALVPGAVRTVEPIARPLGWIATWSDAIHDLLFMTTTGLRDRVNLILYTLGLVADPLLPSGTGHVHSIFPLTTDKFATYDSAETPAITKGIIGTQMRDGAVDTLQLAAGAVEYEKINPLTVLHGVRNGDYNLDNTACDIVRVIWPAKAYAHSVKLTCSLPFDSTDTTAPEDSAYLYAILRKCNHDDDRDITGNGTSVPEDGVGRELIFQTGTATANQRAGMLTFTTFYRVPDANDEFDFRVFIRSSAKLTIKGAGNFTGRTAYLIAEEWPCNEPTASTQW
jgi:hypothetical protein